MTRRSDKQIDRAFMVPSRPSAEVWAVTDYCSDECQAEGVNVVALFRSEQTARQFADARGYPSVNRMSVYHAMERH